MTENRLNEVIQGAMEKVKELADAQTVIGAPIDAPAGTVIIPVSRVSLGFVSGGMDYLSKHSKDTPTSNFGGLGTTGISVQPVGFLIAKENGDVDFLPVMSESTGPNNVVDSVASLLEKTPDILQKFKNVFGRKKETAKEMPEDFDEEIVEEDIAQTD